MYNPERHRELEEIPQKEGRGLTRIEDLELAHILISHEATREQPKRTIILDPEKKVFRIEYEEGYD